MIVKTLKTILLGAGLRGNSYCDYALDNPSSLQIVGVAEPDAVRRKYFQDKHGIADDNCFCTWEDVFGREKCADAVFICTQDNMHYRPAMAAIKQGYHILLEKPISPNPKECTEIAQAAEARGVKIVVCHVLRYTPFFSKIKEIIDSGEIGEIVSVVHNENVGDIRHSHSYVRGNWGVSSKSSPMILAKSCHDTDIIQWLIGKDILRLSSFGSLKYFNKDNCPKDAPPRCTDGCTVDCPYDARKIYLRDRYRISSIIEGHYDVTDDEIETAIKNGPYGRCVFQCDNDVVDHQVVSMEFEGGVTALFSMSSFTPDVSRSIKIMGTKGQIKGHSETESIKLFSFADRSEKEFNTSSIGNHGGGDIGIMNAFCAYLNGDITAANVSEISISTKNHMISFMAEESRLNNGAIIESRDTSIC